MKLLNIQDFNNQLLIETGQGLMQKTVQIFKHDTEKGYGSLGSGILFNFGDNYFIITASHNFIHQGKYVDKGIKNYFIQIGSIFHSLENEGIAGYEEKSYNISKIDVAAVKLKSKRLIEELIKNKKFLNIEDINFHPVQRAIFKKNLEPSDYYILFGFPQSKTKRVIKTYNPMVEDKKFKIMAYCQLEFLKNKVPQRLIDMGFNNHLFFSKIKKELIYTLTIDELSLFKIV